MKLPIYPIVLVIVVAVIAGVAVWRTYAPAESPLQESVFSETLDGDGDHDGDPVETAEALPEESASTPTPVSPTPVTPTPAPAPSGYTMAQVRTHASATSCWTAIDGNVYDLTPWIAKHPGGKSAILRLCGTDGTQSFNDQHGGQARPERELAEFKIGALI